MRKSGLRQEAYDTRTLVSGQPEPIIKGETRKIVPNSDHYLQILEAADFGQKGAVQDDFITCR